jgi:hypothetical protein
MQKRRKFRYRASNLPQKRAVGFIIRGEDRGGEVLKKLVALFLKHFNSLIIRKGDTKNEHFELGGQQNLESLGELREKNTFSVSCNIVASM